MQQQTLTVAQYMTKDPVVIDGGLNLVDTYTRMFQYDFRHLPVYSGGHLVGIISDRDIGHTLATQMLDPQKTTVESICTPNPYVVDPDAPLDQVVQTMCENKLGAALVMREGKMLGIFTVIDAQHALLAQLRRAA
jgi:acetoin utilization protein AcuB